MKSYNGLSAQARQQMRASLTKQQAKASTAKHDSRNFDVENSQHIDPDRADEDEFYTWLDTDEYKCTDFNEAMLKFYEETYSDTLKRINDNYIKDRHPKKADKNTMDVYLAHHMPEAFILQIGNCMDNVDADKLMDCVQDYLAWEDEWNEEHGRPFEILTMALHVDEATPHIHGTRAWKAKDKHGNIIPNREKALEQAGVELPKPDKKVSRCNNRNVTFTAMCRDKWLDICEEHGFDIIREPIKDVKSQNKGDYIREREKGFKERSEALETAQKAFIEAEIQQNAQAYAMASMSLIYEDKEKELAEREKDIAQTETCLKDAVSKFEAFSASESEKIAQHEESLLKREKELTTPTRNELEMNARCMILALQKLSMGNDKNAFDDYYKPNKQALVNEIRENDRKTDELLAKCYRNYPNLRPKQTISRGDDFDR